MKRDYFFYLIALCFVGNVSGLKAQTITIQGEVSGAEDLENIHVINKTSKTFTITRSGGQFEIPVKLQDTLTFSSIQYSAIEVIVDATVIENKFIKVNLEEHINALDEVVVGKILTGNLMLDIGNSEAEPEINFYDVGIPGYKGKPKTQSERRLNVAKTGDLDPILNAISGRTKMLENRVKFEENDKLIHKIRKRLSHDFFSEHPLDEFRQMDFWYFCAEDLEFSERCKDKLDIEILEFLNEKYVAYLDNLNSE